MKIVIAFLVLMSVAAASAGVTENLKIYKPSGLAAVTDGIKPIKIVKPIRGKQK